MYVTQRVAFLQDQKIPINCKPRYTEFIRQILHGILTAQIQNFNDSSAAFIRPPKTQWSLYQPHRPEKKPSEPKDQSKNRL